MNLLARSLASRAGEDAGGPKYQRVFEAIADAIRRGQYKPGDRLPAESALCARLPVSLGTVQRALAKLAEAGLVVRNRRTGTFVADRRSQASEAWVYRFRDPDSGELQLPFVRVLAAVEDRTQGPWRKLFGGQRCVRVDRLLWIESDPPAFTSVYFAWQHGRVLLDVPVEELHGSSLHRLMVERFNLPTLRVEHRISCQPLSRDACRWLKLRANVTGTVWEVSDFSFDDRPVLFQRLQLPQGHRPLEIDERLGGAAPRAMHPRAG
jgi:DNA-binding GntR family transcriptional regulator